MAVNRPGIRSYDPRCPCKKDCPDRNAYCHAECKKPEYLAYLEAKKAEMAERDKQAFVFDITSGHKKNCRRHIRDRSSGRKHWK